MDTNNAEVLEKIMKRAVEWQVNLVLSPKEIDVLLLEIARLKAVERAFTTKDTKDTKVSFGVN